LHVPWIIPWTSDIYENGFLAVSGEEEV
jgi:hypothetical protein